MICKPCLYCPLSKDCELQREKRAAVRGLNITTMKFGCEHYRRLFSPGDVVRVPIWVYDEFNESVKLIVDAVVMRWQSDGGLALLCAFVPGQDNQRPMGNFYPKELTKTGETMPVCKHCGRPKGFDLAKADAEWTCRYGEWDPKTEDLPILECEFEPNPTL